MAPEHLAREWPVRSSEGTGWWHRLLVVALLWLVILSSACRSPGARSPESPYFELPAGSTVTLHRPLTIPAGRAHVSIQQGRETNAVARFEPSCRFEVNRVAPAAQELAPTTFTVVSASRYRRPLGMARVSSPVRLASVEVTAFRGGVYRSREIEFVNFMRLRGAAGVDIRSLSCKITAEPPFGTFLSLTQIRQTLGTVASVEVAE